MQTQGEDNRHFLKLILLNALTKRAGFTYIPCILILSRFFYSPTDAQVNCLKNNLKICIKIDIKTAPTCFGAVSHTIIRERITRAC
jgi:hypothetical protein